MRRKELSCCIDKNGPICRRLCGKSTDKDITATVEQNIVILALQISPKQKKQTKQKHFRSRGLSVLHLKPSGSHRLWANVRITYLLHPDIVNLAVALT